MKTLVRAAGVVLCLALVALLGSYALFHDWSDGHDFQPSEILTLPASLLSAALTRAPAEQQLCCPFSFNTGAEPGVMTFRLRPDQPKVEGSLRAEIRSLSSRIGQRYSYRAEIRADKGWQETDTPTIAMQWHGTKDLWFLESGRQPPLVIHAIGHEWVVSVNADPDLITPFRRKTQERVIGRFPLEPGTWQAFRFDVKWSPRDDGEISVWHNGKLVVTDHGANCFNDVIGPYFKFGNYQPRKASYATADRRVVSLRNVSWKLVGPADVD